jgi:hypothetical protein
MASNLSHASFHITSDTLTPGLKAFPGKLDAQVAQTVDYFALRTEEYAKQNAPWTDRTGNARNLLHAEAFHEPPVRHGITLSHGVPYGIWLEIRFEGKNAIIGPTLDSMWA